MQNTTVNEVILILLHCSEGRGDFKFQGFATKMKDTA